jgi:hypothetical protein
VYEDRVLIPRHNILQRPALVRRNPMLGLVRNSKSRCLRSQTREGEKTRCALHDGSIEVSGVVGVEQRRSKRGGSPLF